MEPKELKDYVDLIRGLDNDYLSFIRYLIDYQREHEHEWTDNSFGIESNKIRGLRPAHLHKLWDIGILDKVYDSNRYKTYRIVDIELLDKAMAILTEEFVDGCGMFESLGDITDKIPPDLFDCILGLDDYKQIILRSVKADKPVHVLLTGPPATAKTLILTELERLPGVTRVVGSSASKSGLLDELFNARPRFLIYDEIDKCSPKDLSVLLELQEKQRVTETKHGKTRTIPLSCWVYATANDITRIPEENLSRFMVLHFKEYSEEEFLRTAEFVLIKREGAEELLAGYIAKKVWNELDSGDIRDAIRISRLAKAEQEVDVIVKALGKTGG